MASPLRGSRWSVWRCGAAAVLGCSQRAEANRVGSWTWLIARCWWPSWTQRALQLVQMAIGYRPKVMVTRADRHSGQRGMRTSRTGGRSLSSVLRAAWRAGERRGVAGGDAPRLSWALCAHYLGQGSWLDLGGPGCAWAW